MNGIPPPPPPQNGMHAPPLAIRPGALPPSPPTSLPSTSHSSINMNNSTKRPPYAGPPTNNGESLPIPRKYSTPPAHMDEQLAIHHRVLRDFLAQTAQDEPNLQPHSRARDKLLRLSPTQFQELSTDVYDELLRRQDERRHPPPAGNVPAFLLPRSNFHPKRNQARQKLSTLAPKKFRELATDVLYELERRHPAFIGGSMNMSRMRSSSRSSAGPPGRRRGSSVSRPYPGPPPPQGTQLPAYVQGLRRPSVTSPVTPYSPTFTNTSGLSTNEYGRALPKNFQNSGMVPSKAGIEDVDDASRYEGSEYNFEGGKRASSRRTTQSSPYGEHFPTTDYQNQVAQLELKVLELENQLKQKDAEISRHESSHKDTRQTLQAEQTRSTTLKADLEKQLTSANTLNSSLQAELDSLRAANTALQESVRNTPAVSTSDEWKSRYESLEKSYTTQQQLTDRVRAEAAQALQEMRVLASRSSDATDREETLHQQISELQAAVEASKTRYAKTKAQLRNMRAISTGILYASQPSAGHYAKDAALRDPAGMVTDVAVTNYQIAVDELLKISREQQPRAVLDYMRTIVASVRSVTTEIDASLAAARTAGSTDEPARKRITKHKSRVAGAANILITAARNYATGNGLSPVSLVDVAVSNLTAAVVELVKLAKIRTRGSLDTSIHGANDSGIEEGSRVSGFGIDGEISPLASSMMSHGEHTNRSIVSDEHSASMTDPRYALSQNNIRQPLHDDDSSDDDDGATSHVLSGKAYGGENHYQGQAYGHYDHYNQDHHEHGEQNEIGMAMGGSGIGMANGLGLGFDPGNSPGPEFGPTFEPLEGHSHSNSPFA